MEVHDEKNKNGVNKSRKRDGQYAYISPINITRRGLNYTEIKGQTLDKI